LPQDVPAPFQGALFQHQSIWAEFSQLEAEHPFGAETGKILRLQQLVPSGFWNRRRFVSGLVRSDVGVFLDGGWGIPQGQEGATADLFEAFTALPDVPFAPVASRSQSAPSPLIVRQFRGEPHSYFYIANATPWPVDAEVMFTAIEADSLQSLSSKEFQVDAQANYATARVHLDGFDFAAAALPAGAEVVDYRGQLPPDAAARLQFEILRLKSKLANAQNAANSSSVLVNANFERSDNSTAIAGWQIQTRGSWRADLDSSVFYEGQSSLRLERQPGQSAESGEPGEVSVTSQPIPQPKSGRISLAVWIQAQSSDAALRVSLRGRFGEQWVERTQAIDLAAANNQGANWQQRTAHFNDLPGELTDIQISFTASGGGTIWLDRVELRDRWLDDFESKTLKQLLNLAGYKLHEQGDLVGCLNILEGYWPRFVAQYYPESAARAESADGGPTASGIRR
jgi:hypothetical protein